MMDGIDTSAQQGAAFSGRAERLARAQRLEQDDVVASEMEALFAQILVKEMRRGLGEGFFGKGAGADTFESWMDEHLADSLANEGVLDLAGRVKASLERERAVAENEQAQRESGADEEGTQP